MAGLIVYHVCASHSLHPTENNNRGDSENSDKCFNCLPLPRQEPTGIPHEGPKDRL